MFIKKTLFRSILVITLFTTCFISPSKGYAYDDLDEFCCSKEVVRLERELSDYLYKNYDWWEQRCYIAQWIHDKYLEKTLSIPAPLAEQHIKTIKQWRNLVINRNGVSRAVISNMQFAIEQMRHLARAKRYKQHEEVSRLLDLITQARATIATQKEKVKRLDYEIKITMDMLVYFYE
ncbi:hypothetical protein [Bartonella saheliensis]|uniref:hypothetical protein n=1 Tax=Bartonella saheliensis TaxID=1457016 RepID=UPI0011A9CA0C|nr:hypothetical protein [Bartonella saheliensis]